MRAVARWMLVAVFVGSVATAGRADDAPLSRADLDKRIGTLVFETTTEGVTLFNSGKPEEFQKTVRSELALYAKIIKDANIRLPT